MWHFKDFKKDPEDVVLVDTNVVINLEKSQLSELDNKAIGSIFKFEFRPIMTDFSLCELIIGSRNICDFQKHCFKLNAMEFAFGGNYKSLCEFISSFDYETLKTNEDFYLFKEKIIQLNKDLLYPHFNRVFAIFCFFAVHVLLYTDENYWNKTTRLYHLIFVEQKEYLVEIIRSIYDTFIFDDCESKELIKGLFRNLILKCLPIINEEKFKIDILTEKLDEALTEKNFRNIVKKILIQDKGKGDYWFEKEFILKAKKIIDQNNEAPFISDGLSYLAFLIIFNGSKFNRNDLIDLLNINFAFTNPHVHYFTNDCNGKWNNFIKIEKELNPDKEILFNK